MPRPRLYSDLAPWFHVLTAPEEYEEEAAFYLGLIRGALPDARTLLELGSGGGNMASRWSRDFEMTLTDLSEEMLTESRAINPASKHLQGDMRTLRLGSTFDAVFVHDAVMYLLTEGDLAQAVETAWVHCRPGGVAVFAPDAVSETFAPGEDTGGTDRAGRSLRYLEWTHDPDPSDTTFTVDYAMLLREGSGPTRCEHDVHVFGLFPRATWLDVLRGAGFQVGEPRQLVLGATKYPTEVFVARRPS